MNSTLEKLAEYSSQVLELPFDIIYNHLTNRFTQYSGERIGCRKLATENLKLIKALKLAIEQRDCVHIICIGYTKELIESYDAEIEKILSKDGT